MIIIFREELPSRRNLPTDDLPKRRAKVETCCPYCRRLIRAGQQITDTEVGWLHEGCALVYLSKGYESVLGRYPARGTAHSTYRNPCPGCGDRIVKGEKVVRLRAPIAEPGWWHQSCDMRRPNRRRRTGR